MTRLARLCGAIMTISGMAAAGWTDEGQPGIVIQRSVTVARFTDDGRWLLTGDQEGTVRRWDLRAADVEQAGVVVGRHSSPYGSVRFLEPASTGRWLVGVFGDGAAQLWDLTAPDPAQSGRLLSGPNERVSIARISPDGRWLVAVGENGLLRVWNLTATDATSSGVTLQGHEGGGRLVHPVISADSRWLATGADRGPGFVWDLTATDGPRGTKLEAGEDVVRPRGISPDNRWLLTGSELNTLHLWDLRALAPSPIVLRGHADPVGNAVFSPDGRWLATASSLASETVDPVVRLWNLASTDVAESATPLAGHEKRIRRMEISADSRWLATTSDDGTARLWNLSASDTKASATVLRHGGAVWGVAIGKDGRWLATGSEDAMARLWDLRAADVSASRRVLRGDGSGIDFVRISADNRWVMGQSLANAVLLWKLE